MLLVVVDGGYGDAAAFPLGLEERGLSYAVGISTTTTAQPEAAQPHTPLCAGRGPRPGRHQWGNGPELVPLALFGLLRKVALPIANVARSAEYGGVLGGTLLGRREAAPYGADLLTPPACRARAARPSLGRSVGWGR
ncbi:transposase [Streptomyces sp. NPDC058914]|uniref:transposase n=1 Tax=Streptomyces sp. NPDC058914 TaxID=3346671 RepID=UPI0036BCD124